MHTHTHAHTHSQCQPYPITHKVTCTTHVLSDTLTYSNTNIHTYVHTQQDIHKLVKEISVAHISQHMHRHTRKVKHPHIVTHAPSHTYSQTRKRHTHTHTHTSSGLAWPKKSPSAANPNCTPCMRLFDRRSDDTNAGSNAHSLPYTDIHIQIHSPQRRHIYT